MKDRPEGNNEKGIPSLLHQIDNNEENVQLQGSHLGYGLRCLKHFLLCYLHCVMVGRGLKVNLFYQFHVVQQGNEGHEIGVRHFRAGA